ncbi:MAG: tRNA threonylcarbamoyladenosine dehydratase [Bacteroidales bacterium]|nr:tRNA threonylcarbamoyladenosine dehydratase [Bacteroidales bacterium]
MSWYERTELLLGKENFAKLTNARVLVCGLGGVGGTAAEQLVRTGIGNICIVDADVISETNINRQIIATHKNIGKIKTEEFRTRLLEINPDLNIDTRNTYLRDEILEQTLLEGWDFVIDAIDTLSPKLNLMRICYQNNIPFVSSMGSGGKTNPSKIRIDDISKSHNCGLARMLRKRLHRLGIYEGLQVVFSDEIVDKSLIIEEESTNKKSNTGTISYIPVIFGCMCAYAAIEFICNQDLPDSKASN